MKNKCKTYNSSYVILNQINMSGLSFNRGQSPLAYPVLAHAVKLPISPASIDKRCPQGPNSKGCCLHFLLVLERCMPWSLGIFSASPPKVYSPVSGPPLSPPPQGSSHHTLA